MSHRPSDHATNPASLRGGSSGNSARPVGRGRGRYAKTAARQAQIINAARRQIETRGIHGVTIDVVATEAHLSTSGLLHHYPSKDHLILGVLQNEVRRLQERHASRLSLSEALLEIAGTEPNSSTAIHLYVNLLAARGAELRRSRRFVQLTRAHLQQGLDDTGMVLTTIEGIFIELLAQHQRSTAH